MHGASEHDGDFGDGQTIEIAKGQSTPVVLAKFPKCRRRNVRFYLGFPRIIDKLRRIFHQPEIALFPSRPAELIHELVAGDTYQPCRGHLLDDALVSARHRREKRFRREFLRHGIGTAPVAQVPEDLWQRHVVQLQQRSPMIGDGLSAHANIIVVHTPTPTPDTTFLPGFEHKPPTVFGGFRR